MSEQMTLMSPLLISKAACAQPRPELASGVKMPADVRVRLQHGPGAVVGLVHVLVGGEGRNDLHVRPVGRDALLERADADLVVELAGVLRCRHLTLAADGLADGVRRRVAFLHVVRRDEGEALALRGIGGERHDGDALVDGRVDRVDPGVGDHGAGENAGRVLRDDLAVDRQLLVQVVLGCAGVDRVDPELRRGELEALVHAHPVFHAADEVHHVVDFLRAALENALLLGEPSEHGREGEHRDQEHENSSLHLSLLRLMAGPNNRNLTLKPRAKQDGSFLGMGNQASIGEPRGRDTNIRHNICQTFSKPGAVAKSGGGLVEKPGNTAANGRRPRPRAALRAPLTRSARR